MLFSMFFGAGNLIFPAKLGVDAGSNFWPAILGFLAAGVLLPVMGIIAIALSGEDVGDLAQRAGKVFGAAFPVLVYLSIGAFYALPRTGAVSFETAIVPLTGNHSTVSSAIFNLIFFGVTLALAWNPNKIVSALGEFLTPLLVVLLVLLIGLSLGKFHLAPSTPTGDYVTTPAAHGLLQGYLTMDALAALAFGIVVISSLESQDVKDVGKSTIIAGVSAGAMLAVIYVGLGAIGRVLPNASSFSNGAGILSEAANQTMGGAGRLIWAAIVVLACLTTSVGLVSATSEFFANLWGRYHAWAVVFTVASCAMATAGLDTVLGIAAPIIGFIYPAGITLIVVALLAPMIRWDLRWSWYLPIWTATVWSALSSLAKPLVAWAPLQGVSLGWVVPTICALGIGLLIDAKRTTPHDQSSAALAS